MTSANVFNLNSVKQGQVLNANAAKGRSKAENPDAAGVFASLMGSNYSTNFNMPSVNTKINNNVLQQTNAADNYDRYQYQDNTIRQAARDVVTDVIDNSTDTLDQFQGDVVRTVAEQLGVSEDSVKDMMESLGLTAFDLLNPENLAQLAMQLTGETSPMDLLMNDQFQGLMQQMDQLGGQLANELNLQPAQMEELIAQMDILQTPETLTDEEIADILPKLPDLTKWANDIMAYATDAALNHGKQWKGFKVVEGRSVRRYSDEDAVIKAAKTSGYTDIFKTSLITLTEMEKRMGKKKFNEILGGLIIKPPGRPALVPDTDKRTAITGNDPKTEFTEVK